MAIETKHLRIFGRVQGVGYRAWVAHTAENMDLTGWVRNRKDGSVEAVVTGEEKNIAKFASLCYSGPASAKVETVNVGEGVDEEIKGFEIRETA